MRPSARRAGLLALALLALLGACGAPYRALRPDELPFHATFPPGLTLHWRLDREPDRVVAVGGVSVGAPENIEDVTVELLALDRSGRVVGRARDVTTRRSFEGRDLWPFTIRLPLRGSEEQFVVRIADFRWKVLPTDM